jgi:hypothetical protein
MHCTVVHSLSWRQISKPGRDRVGSGHRAIHSHLDRNWSASLMQNTPRYNIYIYIILIIIYIIYIYVCIYIYMYTKMHRSEFTCEVILTMKHVYNTLSTVAVTPLCVWRLPGRKRPPCRPAITPHHDLATVTLLCKFLRCSKSVQRFIDVETSNTDQINLQINKVFSLKEIGAAAPRQVPSSCLRAAWVTWKRTVTE